jgi:hypothetical protein
MGMREILFRGKRYGNSGWAFGCYYKQLESYGGACDDSIIITTHEDLSYDQALDYYEVLPETVGQFTGLTDKNGKKIFEGDIIQHGKRKGTIFYYGNFGMFMISWIPNGGANIFMNVLHTEVDVIGNIHDNPELLEVENA